MVGKPLPKTQSSMRAKSNAKASKKRSMFNLFMVARPFSLPPPADVTSGNKETDEDNDEALRVIIRWTKQKKRKHRLAAVVGRLESEWSFIRQVVHHAWDCADPARGRFMGKRVVFLKQLKSGLLLLTGPFKINGVPIRRVNHAYVITTSTKVDVFGINVPEALFLSTTSNDVPVKWVCRELEGQRPFGAEDMQPLEAPRFMWWADELVLLWRWGRHAPCHQGQ
ncbi:hypothetical protein GUJ93_ZPchr0001g32337 [Zizania palustris]|uniref:60S ribosomal protein L6 n=1 Tax=Zizania palustris TaxID=103762 RepID=A0A8J5S0T6_ZIZPA|nr:hypothetical protein GUJ93_ZPchr0001g32337 [Zizania palustris]